ncbi:NHLP bacteriocin system secretion protein [Kamptonema sp. UHCC 0994]|uniref:NHLP bacteriocin system secretion protein n=1 Tax=Kamptonema sp. UHCC 0994 TaxID=3031329 RepID=UPI0023B9F4B2|nr:NHLP bacteriocin system secretion protein [Kamptonema sp. UHCC 0994]MDF0555522.1 NHLP bacteriocin system secretion protein [Kamptonema sp. UHCC 0994]
MSEPNKSHYYRTEALEKLSSPERLDQLMQVVTLKDWLSLVALGILLLLLVIWSIVGEIPISVTGEGILMQIRPVVEIPSHLPIQRQENKIVGLIYFAVEDGKKIQSGMPISITPTTVKRERFGGIIGKVTNVSDFPVTKESATNLIGNPQVVEHLIGKGDVMIQVIAELESNPSDFSGYKWSYRQGPKLKISAGSIATARVKLEERSPITFVLPILRQWSGIYD